MNKIWEDFFAYLEETSVEELNRALEESRDDLHEFWEMVRTPIPMDSVRIHNYDWDAARTRTTQWMSRFVEDDAFNIVTEIEFQQKQQHSTYERDWSDLREARQDAVENGDYLKAA